MSRPTHPMIRRPYIRSETHDALHPEKELKKCSCGVLFQVRENPQHLEDNPDLCLSCNRKDWSILFGVERDSVVRQTISDSKEIENYKDSGVLKLRRKLG